MTEQNPSLKLEGAFILNILTPEESAQLQAELQQVIDKWCRVKALPIVQAISGVGAMPPQMAVAGMVKGLSNVQQNEAEIAGENEQ